MDRQEVAAILAKIKDAAMTGNFEPFKTSSHYDGTIQEPSLARPHQRMSEPFNGDVR